MALIKKLLPVKYFVTDKSITTRNLLTSFGLQRSGQHLVIDWICRGLKNDTIHFNHCRFFWKGLQYTLSPVTGRRVIYGLDSTEDSGIQGRKKLKGSIPEILPQNLFFSIEDISLNDYLYTLLLRKYSPIVISILRDPANWLASSMRHGVHSNEKLRKNKETMKEYLTAATLGQHMGHPLVDINYNTFSQHYSYREEIARRFASFNIDKAELALLRMPQFGGGSSFKGSLQRSSNTLDRWKEYEDDDEFLSILNDPELLLLSKRYFGNIEAIKKIEEIVGQNNG